VGESDGHAAAITADRDGGQEALPTCLAHCRDGSFLRRRGGTLHAGTLSCPAVPKVLSGPASMVLMLTPGHPGLWSPDSAWSMDRPNSCLAVRRGASRTSSGQRRDRLVTVGLDCRAPKRRSPGGCVRTPTAVAGQVAAWADRPAQRHRPDLGGRVSDQVPH
jgi:hypothetical protein